MIIVAELGRKVKILLLVECVFNVVLHIHTLDEYMYVQYVFFTDASNQHPSK